MTTSRITRNIRITKSLLNPLYRWSFIAFTSFLTLLPMSTCMGRAQVVNSAVDRAHPDYAPCNTLDGEAVVD